MNFKKTLNILAFLITSLIFFNSANAGLLQGTDVTPDVYKIMIKRITFLPDEAGSAFHFIKPGELASPVDIGSVNAGAAVRTIGKGKIYPPGTYSKIEVVISGDFVMKGATANAKAPPQLIAAGVVGGPCKTEAGNQTLGVGFGGLTFVSVGTAALGAASEQTVKIPDGHEVEEVLKANGIEKIPGTDDYIFTADLGANKFTIPKGGKKIPPNIKIIFDVKDKLELITIAPNRCLAVPGAPNIKVMVFKSNVAAAG